ncbi:MAG: LysR family transcriptional regulator [Bacteroidota bacterium]
MITENYQIELRHYTYFLTVAEELHFRRAAERLFISQPGLSNQIKQMEELLGVELFIRDKKKVVLTPAGRFLKQEVEFILSQLQNVKKQVKLIGEGSLGEVRIGFLGSAMQNVIPNLLLKLQAESPDIQTSLEELSNRAQIQSLIKGQLDLGFVRLGEVPDSLESRPVFEDTFSLVLPMDSQIDTSNFKGMHQVANKSFILFSKEYSPLYFDTVMSICKEAGFQPYVSHKSVHAHTIFRLVENGLGIAIVPTSLKYGFQMGVKFIELKKIRQRAVLSVVWNKENRNPVLKNCVELLFKT